MSKRIFGLISALPALLAQPQAAFSQSSQTAPPTTAQTPAVAVPEVVVQQPPKAAAAQPPAVTPRKPVAVQTPPSPPKPQATRPVQKAPVAAAQSPAETSPPLTPVTGGEALKLEIAPAVNAPNFSAPISGQTVTETTRETTKDRPVFRAGDLLADVPGVSVKQGNGPRDIGVSIRGSNARNGFGVRNIVVFEDGFPVTQPDGLSRTDLTDPHAYGGVDVFRGPSSSLFGNYATGGAINFRTRPGREIDGVEYGIDVGSFGYLNNYITGGKKIGNAEFSIFASDVRGDGYMGNGEFNTQTVNALLTLKITPQDTITLKVIDNQLETNLPIRQSLAQFRLNPYAKGCETNATKAPGCPTVSLFNNGYNGFNGTSTLTAAQAGLSRDDSRTILAARWEHAFDPLTIWRTQIVWDDRDISQPTGTTSAVGDFISWNLSSDLTKRSEVFGLEATHFVGVYYNFLPNDSNTFNVGPAGNATLGRQTVNTKGVTSNLGFRLREELKLDPRWMLAAGIAVESTHIGGINIAYAYNNAGVATQTGTRADRDFYNTAPEVSLTYRPNDTFQARGRVSTGYGTPTIGNLFIDVNGNPGNNTDLKPQSNLGYDVGFIWSPARAFKLDVTGFYEFFEDEIVSQSPGPGKSNFQFNAPASEHRGIEVAAMIKPVDGVTLTAAYLYNDQIYKQYTEQLSAGSGANAVTRRFDRAGNKIPGVAPNELTARLAYETPSGPLKGFGAFVEYQWRDAFYMDNANLLQAGPAETINLNVHYNTVFASGWVREAGAYFEVHNVLDRANIAAANNISNSIVAGTGAVNGAGVLVNSGGSIYAAEPRTYYGGMKIKF